MPKVPAASGAKRQRAEENRDPRWDFRLTRARIPKESVLYAGGGDMSKATACAACGDGFSDGVKVGSSRGALCGKCHMRAVKDRYDADLRARVASFVV
jgi:hypothetical protein